MWISITCNTSLGHYVHTQKISQEQVVLDIRNYNSSVRSIITDAWRTARTLPHHYCLALSTITIMMLKVCLSNILNGHGGPTTYPIAFANCPLFLFPGDFTENHRNSNILILPLRCPRPRPHAKGALRQAYVSRCGKDMKGFLYVLWLFRILNTFCLDCIWYSFDKPILFWQ